MGLAAGAALIAAAVPAASLAAVAARVAAATRPPAWRAVRVPSSVVSPATLNDVSALGPAEAWAVGADAETGYQRGTPLIVRWNGRAWTRVALPGVSRPGFLCSVSVGSRSDVWAVGTDRSGAVALHWNGRRWRTVGFPGARTATIMSVAAAPGGRAWMVGWRNEAFGATAILVERWNGTAWHIVRTGLGQGGLSMVRVSASGDVWAAGFDANFPLIVHEHGGRWTSFEGPGGITDVSDVLAVSAHDVWVAADDIFISPAASVFTPHIIRWNGRNWTDDFNVPAVSMPAADLSISPDRVGQPQWAGASVIFPSSTLYGYHHGTTWSTVRGATATPASVYAVFTVTAHIPGTDATWAVGGSFRDNTDVTPISAIIEFNPGPPPA